MRPPCEIVVSKVLPTIRAVLVKDLLERHDLSQKEIADKLGVTQAAVSQYLSSVRGTSNFEKELRESEIKSEIQSLSDRIAEKGADETRIISEYCKICNSMREKGILCKLHGKNIEKLSEEDCEVCLSPNLE